MGLQKNVAGQKWVVFAFNRTDNVPKTGDALNITANLRIDGGAANAVDDTNPTELEDGYYVFDLTQVETNGDLILLTAQSSTADIQVVGCPAACWTVAPNFNALGIESDGDLTKVNTLNGHTAQTGDSFARIGATGSGLTSLAQASVATEARLAELDAGNIPADVDAILMDTGTTIDNHLTDIKGTGFVKDTHSLVDIEAYVDILDDGTSGNAKIATDVAAVLVDTGTTLDNHLTDIKGTGFVKDTHSLVDIEAYVDLIDDGTSGLAKIAVDVAAILVDTNELQTDWVDGGRLDLILDARAAEASLSDGTVQVGTIQDGAIGAAAVADIFSTTTIAEAYAADGAAGTPAQLMYETLQNLTEFAISGTTWTTKKRDGSTTAATYTLDDDSAPTSKTRAT